jgi:hypothetical protein
MLAQVYLNWTGTADEFVRVKGLVKNIVAQTEGVSLEGLYIPNNQWNYAVLYKFDNFEKFLEFQKQVRSQLRAQNLSKIPDRELVLMIEENRIIP